MAAAKPPSPSVMYFGAAYDGVIAQACANDDDDSPLNMRVGG